MNDDGTNNAERDIDSSGGRISSHRRDLANIALEIVAVGRTVERLSKLVDKVPSSRRNLEILSACDEIAVSRSTIEVTESHLREVAQDTRVEMYAVARKKTLIQRLDHWLFGES